MPTNDLVSPKKRTHRSQGMAGRAPTTLRIYLLEDPPTPLLCRLRTFEFQGSLCWMPTGHVKALGWRRALAPQPSVLLLSLPSTAQAELDWLRELHASLPLLPILAIAEFTCEGELLEALEAGASGCLRDSSSASELIQAAHDLLQGGCVVEPKLAKRILAPLGARRRIDCLQSTILSCRELEVLRLVANGFSNARVGRYLGLSSTTVRTHLERIYQKLHVANRVEAVARSIALGLFQNDAVTPHVRPL